LLGEEINITKPDMDTSMLRRSEKIKNRYVLLFPGASQYNKKWSSRNFKKVAEFIFNNFPLDIALSGSKQESYLFDEIVPVNSGNRFLNFFGNTLPELAKLISEAELLLSNETSAIHIAAAVNTPFICISNGNHFGRFHPYSKEIFEEAFFIYPQEIMDKINDIKVLSNKYRFGSDLNINQIKPETVIPIIKKLLTKPEP
jgi:ADP-heptose:LPS heptosyltransferase